jgi:hypothetical protein
MLMSLSLVNISDMHASISFIMPSCYSHHNYLDLVHRLLHDRLFHNQDVDPRLDQ